MTKTDERGIGYSQLARDFSPFEAQVLLGRLQAEGIDAHLTGVNHAQANPLMLNALGGVRLFVRDEQQSLALETMAAADQGEYALEEESRADEATHAASDSARDMRLQHQWTSSRKVLVLVAMLLLAISLAIVVIKVVWAQSYDYFPYSMTPEPTSRIIGKWVFSALVALHPALWLFLIVRELRKSR